MFGQKRSGFGASSGSGITGGFGVNSSTGFGQFSIGNSRPTEAGASFPTGFSAFSVIESPPSAGKKPYGTSSTTAWQPTAGTPASNTGFGFFGGAASGRNIFEVSTSAGMFNNTSVQTSSSAGMFPSSRTVNIGAQTAPFPHFSGTTNDTFGRPKPIQTSSNIFGQVTPPVSSGSGSLFPTFTFTGVPTGTTLKFSAPAGKDTMMINQIQKTVDTQNQCITSMKEYENKSLDELRFEDYLSGKNSKTVSSSRDSISGVQTGGSLLWPSSTTNTWIGNGLNSQMQQQKSPSTNMGSTNIDIFGQKKTHQSPLGDQPALMNQSVLNPLASKPTQNIFAQLQSNNKPIAAAGGATFFPPGTSQPTTTNWFTPQQQQNNTARIWPVVGPPASTSSFFQPQLNNKPITAAAGGAGPTTINPSSATNWFTPQQPVRNLKPTSEVAASVPASSFPQTTNIFEVKPTNSTGATSTPAFETNGTNATRATHDFILALSKISKSNDYPIFRKFNEPTGKSEEIIKSRAVSGRVVSTPPKYRISSMPSTNKIRTSALLNVSSNSKRDRSFFEEEEEEEIQDQENKPDFFFVPRRNVKKLKLKAVSLDFKLGEEITEQSGAEIADVGLAINSVTKEELDKNLVALKNRHSSALITCERSSTDENIPPHPAGIVLRRCGYSTIPSLNDLTMDADGKCVVNSFTIIRQGYGQIYFQGPLNVANLNLDAIVIFRHKEVTVYPDDSAKPPQGEGLNRRAEITLDRVWPVDKTTGEFIKNPDSLTLMGYEDRLVRATHHLQAKFIEYRSDTGSWVFRVNHFS